MASEAYIGWYWPGIHAYPPTAEALDSLFWDNIVKKNMVFNKAWYELLDNGGKRVSGHDALKHVWSGCQICTNSSSISGYSFGELCK